MFVEAVGPGRVLQDASKCKPQFVNLYTLVCQLRHVDTFLNVRLDTDAHVSKVCMFCENVKL